MTYDVVIVGAGPAGIFSAIKLLEEFGDDALSVAILDKGPDISFRSCPALDTNSVCKKCERCPLNSGWGGAGLFSDGKITLSPKVGGWLAKIIGEHKLMELLKEMDEIFLRFGAPNALYGLENDAFEDWHRRAAMVGLKLEHNVIRHIGTDITKKVLTSMRNYVGSRIEVLLDHEVKRILVNGGVVSGLELSNGEKLDAKCVVVAPGRLGSEWFMNECSRLGIKTYKNPVDLGVRVELPYEIMAPITDDLYEPKLKYTTKRFDDQVRTFCVNPKGEVITERYDDIVTVNGHSLSRGSSDNTNFAILVSTNFTEPFKDPISFGKYIARLANNISSGVIVQRFGDLLKGRRSTSSRIERGLVVPTLRDATPGDLSFVLPFRILTDIVEMMKAMDKLISNVAAKDTLLYGIEAKFYSSRVDTNEDLETTSVKNLFVAGDGVGLSRGLSQAAVSGIHVAKNILKRLRS